MVDMLFSGPVSPSLDPAAHARSPVSRPQSPGSCVSKGLARLSVESLEHNAGILGLPKGPWSVAWVSRNLDKVRRENSPRWRQRPSWRADPLVRITPLTRQTKSAREASCQLIVQSNMEIVGCGGLWPSLARRLQPQKGPCQLVSLGQGEFAGLVFRANASLQGPVVLSSSPIRHLRALCSSTRGDQLLLQVRRMGGGQGTLRGFDSRTTASRAL